MKLLTKSLSFLCFLLMAVPAQAEETSFGKITLSTPYIRAMPESAKVTSGYMDIHNAGDEPDQLLEATSPNAVRIEIHEMRIDNEVMRMRALPDGLEIPAGTSVSLAPGGYHLMIFEPTTPLVTNKTFPLILHFAKAGKIEVDFDVKNIKNAKANTKHDHGHKHEPEHHDH